MKFDEKNEINSQCLTFNQNGVHVQNMSLHYVRKISFVETR